MVTGAVTSASVIGMRGQQEDRFVAARVDDGWLVAVFDGHCGAETAAAAAAMTEEAFRDARSAGGGGESTVGATIGKIAAAVAHRVEGSSASVAWIDEAAGRVAVGILGDSPVVVRDAEARVVIGPVHNTAVSRADVERAVERGAIFVDGYLVDPHTREGVNLTRTIGDSELTFLGRTPEMLSVDLGESSFVLVASDGVFTPVAPNEDGLVERVGALVSSGADAEAIVHDALASGSLDNVTVVLWRSSAVPVVGSL